MHCVSLHGALLVFLSVHYHYMIVMYSLNFPRCIKSRVNFPGDTCLPGALWVQCTSCVLETNAVSHVPTLVHNDIYPCIEIQNKVDSKSVQTCVSGNVKLYS